jgi:hypothetical protein
LAHLIDERLQGRLCGRTHQEWKDINGYVGCGGAGGGIWPSRPGEHQYEWEPSRVVGNTAEQRLSERGCGEIHESRSVEELKRPDQIVGNSEGRQDHGREPGDLGIASRQGRCGNDAVDSTGEIVGNSESQRPTTQRAKHEGLSGELCATSASSENIIGDRQIKPSLGGDADGSTSRMDYAELSVTCDNRTDELRLLGNGVVPATATRAFLTLVEELNESPSLSTSSS